MKRTTLLNRHLSLLIASLGHMDEIIVADAGLPIPQAVNVIDLAIIPGLPSFFDVLQAIRSELAIEKAVWAEEAGQAFTNELKIELDAWSLEIGKPILYSTISHQAFKIRSRDAITIIRTGEIMPFANLILVSGVVF